MDAIPSSDQTKDYEIGIFCFCAKHMALTIRAKTDLTYSCHDVHVAESLLNLFICLHWNNPLWFCAILDLTSAWNLL